MWTRLMAALALLALGSAADAGSYSYSSSVIGGYHYSSHELPGYRYYAQGWYGTSTWFPSGYYYTPQKAVITVAAFVEPRYIVVNAATYQPQAVQVYQTQPLASVQQLQQVQPAQAAPVQDCHAKVKVVEDRLNGIEAMLKQLIQQQVQAVPQAAPQAADGHGLFVTYCAGCHDSSNAKEKGKGYAFFQDMKMLELTEKQKNDFYAQILGGKMPKDRKIEAAHGAVMMQHLSALPAKKE